MTNRRFPMACASTDPTADVAPARTRDAKATPAARAATVHVLEALEGRLLFSAAYSIKDLSTLAGFTNFDAGGLNDRGEVAGTASNNTGSRGFVYRAGQTQALAGTYSAADINDSGQITGSFPV